MYLEFLVNIPNSPGKITYRRKNGVDYVQIPLERHAHSANGGMRIPDYSA